MPTTDASTEFNVRSFGAEGDGIKLDTEAIRKAIAAADAGGGGTVRFPAGRYVSHSIRLVSNLRLAFDPGAVLAAAPAPGNEGEPGYDLAEPNEWSTVHRFQDFGHSHWHNSLIWGEGIENLQIVGPGLIDGTELGKGLDPATSEALGTANKALALKNCRRVTLRDFNIYRGGHFALLATGVDQLTIDNLTVDTNRDALDIDCCQFVQVSNCRINTINDDAIVLKTSYGLGYLRATENVTISNCVVSGYDIGSVLDGSYRTKDYFAPDRDGPTGRIKLGTESNGDFRNITISNIVFDRCRGLALESVDGSCIENVTVSNITMRNLSNSAIFLRLGNRARGPKGTPVGSIRGVSISGVIANGVDGRFPIQLQGLPGHPIRDVRISDVRIESKGGITMQEVAEQPKHLVNDFFLRTQPDETGVTGPRDPFVVPLREKAYPEPSMFGLLPACGVYARHVEGLSLRDIDFSFIEADERPLILLDQVNNVQIRALNSGRPLPQHRFRLQSVTRFSAIDCIGHDDQCSDSVELEIL
ncbi:MAG: right-handed parallel beta-helix repeat-containing protein [Opitutales bacterium]|nr:right-handed parallel beta-helix repeat-containing protein [Opitutales bacterium]